MRLTETQVDAYASDGFVVVPGLFSSAEVDTLSSALPELIEAHREGHILEEGSGAVRSVMGGQDRVAIWERFVRHPRLVHAAAQLLADPASLYQFKVNTKEGFKGAEWSWHQDFIFWHEEDGMAYPLALTAAVFLDDVLEFNGPLLMWRGTHRHGSLAARVEPGTDWRANAQAKLKYSLDETTISRIAERHELVSLKGSRGTAVLFHCNLVHGSMPNMTPYRRAIAFCTYTSVNNRFDAVERPRPQFVADCRGRAVEALADDCLLD
jgi:ectoine hydroxylase-related dioxygenase (phytanoyl-CoA dioxygenase family)